MIFLPDQNRATPSRQTLTAVAAERAPRPHLIRAQSIPISALLLIYQHEMMKHIGQASLADAICGSHVEPSSPVSLQATDGPLAGNPPYVGGSCRMLLLQWLITLMGRASAMAENTPELPPNFWISGCTPVMSPPRVFHADSLAARCAPAEPSTPDSVRIRSVQEISMDHIISLFRGT